MKINVKRRDPNTGTKLKENLTIPKKSNKMFKESDGNFLKFG